MENEDLMNLFTVDTMKHFDTNHSGYLEHDEYIKFCKKAVEEFKLDFKEEDAEKSWKDADLNHDNKIDLSEL